jgi:CHAT domain-containing protein
MDEDLTNNKTYLRFLSWLWREGVKLVLDELGYHAVSSVESLDALPRIWWIGTGLASSLPFHAAGDNTAGQTENAYYCVVSSYTPTIKALKYAKQRVISYAKSCSGPPKILIVTMATTPGADELPKAEPERSEVIAAVGASTIVKALDQPNVASVMEHIGQFQIVHFACHGESDPVDPSKSGLLLQTANMATAEPEQDVLSVSKISLAHLSQADIAYLSACSTAENGVIALVDEVLHVVSGFQVAGFRHVIGCLWPSNDGVCIKVAKSFYSQLVKGGEMRYSDREVALALHNAVLEVKNSNEYYRRPLRWAQYVHFGA